LRRGERACEALCKDVQKTKAPEAVYGLLMERSQMGTWD